jgi:DNA polymerase
MLHLDVETRATVDLRKTNAYVYFDDPDTSLWMAAWAFDQDEPVLWWPGEPCPQRIVDHVESGGLIAAWNAAFERLAWRTLLTPVHGWPEPRLEQYRCVMAAGYAVGLPGKLEYAANALGLEQRKDSAGGRLMLQMAKPRKPRLDEDQDALLWWDDQIRIDRLGAYCLQDVRTEQAVCRLIPQLREAEQQIWFLDQRINDRGVHIDLDLCLAARNIITSTTHRLDTEIKCVTGRSVRSVANVGDLMGYLRCQQVDASSVSKDQIVNLLVRDDLSPQVRRALEIRQEGAKTSTAKINAMLARRQDDGRMRGTLQYHGAVTGRWGARGAQLQNLPRPGPVSGFGELVPSIIDDMLHGLGSEMMEMLYGPPLTCVSDCLRGTITAAPGNILRAADLSSIEARVIAWLAGETWKLAAFTDYDQKQGPDLYILAARGIFCHDSINDHERQVGKVSELALGFQGGPGALRAMAKGYGVDIANAHDAVMMSASEQHIERAEEGWLERGKKTGMSWRAWITAELIKLAWRAANPAIVALWSDIETAAILAVRNPSTKFTAGKLTYIKVGSWLLCRLPSGRCIAYPFPSVIEKETPWGSKRPALTYWAVDPFTRQWSIQHFYGGLGAENVVQATARDVMAEAMLRVDAAGYHVVLTVHDEIVSETAQGFGDVRQFNDLVKLKPSWSNGLPIEAKAWEGERYRK